MYKGPWVGLKGTCLEQGLCNTIYRVISLPLTTELRMSSSSASSGFFELCIKYKGRKFNFSLPVFFQVACHNFSKLKQNNPTACKCMRGPK